MNVTVKRFFYDTINLATFSQDPDLRDCVGCLITERFSFGEQPIASGWNHTLNSDKMRSKKGKAMRHVVHAETAAIQDALRFIGMRQPAPLSAYSTKEPCVHCLVQLAHAGVEAIHFIDAIPAEKGGRHLLHQFPSIKIYKEHRDQLPLFLRALSVCPAGSTEPVPSTPS